MTVLIGLIVAILNMLNGFMATDENKLLLLRSMGANKWQILKKLVIPSSLARVYFHAENKRRYGVDRFDHGRIYRIQGGYRLSDRLRGQVLQARTRP